MKFLFVSDSFKGSLTSEMTGDLLERAAKEIFPDCICEKLPVADGGEGTVNAVVRAVSGEIIPVTVHGPLMEMQNACYGKLDEKRAVLEMASASGYALVPAGKKNPLYTTTYGTGEMIRDALDKGFRDISIAIGGSATNDGGMGCMRALGVRFLDENGAELDGAGKDLGKVAHIDCSNLDERIKETKFTVMCDVTNPLCGENGATYTFGKQKGGTPEILEELEQGMRHYRDVIVKEFGVNPDEMKGSGAAGGLGAALLVFLKATLRSGIETVLELIHFDAYLKDTSLVITGEGRTDRQSCFGKVVQGVGERCKYKNIPAIALVGSMGEGAENIYRHGILSIMTTVNDAMSLEEAMEHAEELYYNGAVRMFRMVKAGMGLK